MTVHPSETVACRCDADHCQPSPPAVGAPDYCFRCAWVRGCPDEHGFELVKHSVGSFPLFTWEQI